MGTEMIATGIVVGFVTAILIIDLVQGRWKQQVNKRIADQDTKISLLMKEHTELEPIDQNWDPGPETVIEEQKTAGSVSQNTQVNCPKCGGKSYLRDGKCVKCHHGLV